MKQSWSSFCQHFASRSEENHEKIKTLFRVERTVEEVLSLPGEPAGSRVLKKNIRLTASLNDQLKSEKRKKTISQTVELVFQPTLEPSIS
jgi:hypothetical protein